jgi:Flp pilus assembly protein TadD
VFLHTRSVFIFIALAGLSQSQSFSGNQPWPLDASNSEMGFAKTLPGEVHGSAGGTVSVQELQRPLEGKGLRMLQKAKDLMARGDHARGMEQMRAALREPGAEPYAWGMLGAEHLRRGDLASAVMELQSAVNLLPGVPEHQSNLALTLAALHRNDEALVHARKAVQLNPSRPKTRYVIGVILLEMRHNEEAEFHLRLAAKEVSGAQVLLDKYLTRADQ